MSIIVNTVIDCPLETVFEMYMRPEFRVEWDDNVVRAYYENPDDDIMVGTRFHVIVTVMGRERDTLRFITAYKPPHVMTYETLVTGLRIRSQQTFEAHGNQTKMQMHATFAGNGLLRILAFFVRQQQRGHMQDGLMSFKKLVEARCS